VNAHTFTTANDELNWIHGSHQFSFGARLTRALALDLANVRSIGNYAINGQTTGLGLADFMAGILSQMRQSIPNNLDVRQWFFGAYAQDTWKASHRLTLNFGLRWEPFFPMQVGDSKVYTFDIGRFYVYNVLNNVRFKNPAVTLSNPSTFGNTTSAEDPRILRLAMKFTF
jgi:hypothetical protein